MNPWDEKAADVAELVALEASEWSPAVATRFDCFMSGARWQREALLADDMIERVVHDCIGCGARYVEEIDYKEER